MTAPQPQFDPYQAQSKKSGLMLTVGLVLLALMGGFALGKGGLFGRSQVAGQGAGTDLNVPGQNGGLPIQAGDTGLDIPTELGFEPQRPDLSLGSQPSGPTIQIGDKMPADVRDWLIHLERTESERQRMTKSQLGSLMGMMTGMSGAALSDLTAEAFGEESTGQNYDPSKREKVAGETKAKRQSWKELNAFFNSKQPPAECVPIKNAYEQCLGETSAMMMDVLGQLERSQDDPQGAINSLMGMMGTSAGKIDVAAKQSDQLVGSVCRKYETFKWFSITGDIGGGLGGLGMGGLGDLGGLLGGG